MTQETTDIVARLRSYARSPGMWSAGHPDMANAAADEIERLRAQVAELELITGAAMEDDNAG